MNDTPKIYVADLAAYNVGRLHGIWIEACEDLDVIWEQIDQMLSESPMPDAEEYAIHDYEGFGGYVLSEYEGIETAHEIACFIEDYPEFGGALLGHFSILEHARSAAEQPYQGCYKSLTEYARELTEETTEIPDSLQYYIDYERMGRDMEMSGDIFTIETGFHEVHVFWNS